MIANTKTMRATKEPLKASNNPVVKKHELPSIGLSAFVLMMVILLVAPITGEFILSNQFRNEVHQLFAEPVMVSKPAFSYNQLEGLPKPVQQYFKHVLKEGQPQITSVRLLQKGQFKTDLKKKWIDLEGEQYVTIDKPGFVWLGKTHTFSARDMYLTDKGKLVVFAYHLFKLQEATGEKYNEGELLRWLGESVCYPTNLLPKKNLQWLPIDDKTAQLNFQYNGISLHYKVHFNDQHEIFQMETFRHMGDGKKEKWINKLSNYQERNGVLIPVNLEAGWQLKEEYFAYAKLKITKIEHNKSESF